MWQRRLNVKFCFTHHISKYCISLHAYKFHVLNVVVINHIHIRHHSQSINSNLLSLIKSMPKDQKHVAEAQKQRKKIKEKSSRYVPAKVSLQVLGTGAEGAPRSLYIFSDQTRYLFNCGEGTQRLAHEHKMKLSRLEHIFITQPIWKNFGGLPGTALTIQDVGVPEIVLHGPKGLSELFKATKRFVIMKNLKVKTAECNELTKFEDSVMTVHYVPLERIPMFHKRVNDGNESHTDSSDESTDLSKVTQTTTGSPKLEASTSTRSRKRRRSKSRNKVVDDDIDYYSPESKVARGRHKSGSRSSSVSSNSAVSDDVKQSLIETKGRGVVMCFICRLQPRPGALNLDKCVKLGVPAGPLLGKLKNGEEVVLNNGTIVQAKDVCEPDDPGPIFLVIDCPTEEYLDNLVGNVELAKHQIQTGRDEDMPALVVHFTPKDIIGNPRYQMWMDLFSPSTRHILINDMNSCMGSISVHRIQYKLNLLNNDIFPLLGDTGTEFVDKKKINSTPSDATYWDGIILPRTCCNFHLRPKTGFDNSAAVKVFPIDYIDETMAIEGFEKELKKLQNATALKLARLRIRPYPQVLFLGTGSCIPNKTRNTSGILLQTSKTSNILIDCGEGTYGQIVRFFGDKESREVLANTDAVYVSHLHADHHIGLIGFLQGRHRARKLLKLPSRPVYLLAPLQILSWLNFYHLCFEDIDDYYELISNGDLLKGNHQLDHAKKYEMLETLNMSDISTCFVRHCPNAFGVAFQHKLGFKITYSGDTMPSDALVELGKRSDLLIHEATMEDDLADEAVVKMHSTTSQAITVGEKMEAKYTLLTHFSQRYAKLPRFNDNFHEQIGIAFDNMKLKLDQLPLVPLLYPSLKMMFAEHYEELEQKAVKRQLRAERERSKEEVNKEATCRVSTEVKHNAATSDNSSIATKNAKTEKVDVRPRWKI